MTYDDEQHQKAREQREQLRGPMPELKWIEPNRPVVLKCDCGGVIHPLKKDNFPVALAACIKCQKDHGIYQELLKKTLSELTGVPADELEKGPHFKPAMTLQEAFETLKARLPFTTFSDGMRRGGE